MFFNKLTVSTLNLIALLLFCCSCNTMYKNQAEDLYHQGQQSLSQGRIEESQHCFEKSLTLSQKAGFKAGIAHNLNEMGILKTMQQNYAKARRLFAQAIAIYEELKLSSEISKALNNIAITYIKANEPGNALNSYKRLIEWDRKSENRLGEAITYYNMGILYQSRLQEKALARLSYEKALALFKQLKHKTYIRAVENKISLLDASL